MPDGKAKAFRGRTSGGNGRINKSCYMVLGSDRAIAATRVLSFKYLKDLPALAGQGVSRAVSALREGTPQRLEARFSAHLTALAGRFSLRFLLPHRASRRGAGCIPRT